MQQKVIFDCDNTMGLRWNEIDDGLTLLYLLSREEINLLGVTTTFGNNTIENVWKATSKLRDMYDFDLPLKMGEGQRHQPPTEAAEFLVEQVNLYPGEVSILATGPLGNLRAAKELDTDFFQKTKQVVCMGGMVKQPMVMGGQTLSELNFSADPEGTLSVLHAECPVIIMNAHVCLQVPFQWRHALRAKGWHPKIAWWRNLWHFGFGLKFRQHAFYLWDLLPAVYLTNPELFSENPVKISSSLQDLEDGTLIIADEGQSINMPDRIIDPKQFYEILFRGWEQFFNTYTNR
ncbi:MAG: nucleoside hydrolase [Anaerolineae bacterium]|nr:nucleoside hydrolase [Anaerolineae bacterium]